MRTRPALVPRLVASSLRPRLHQQHVRVLKAAAQEYKRGLEREQLMHTQHARLSLSLLDEALSILEREHER